MEILLLQPVFLLLRLQNAFGIQIYAFMKGFPPRSGEDFQDGPHGADAGPYRIGDSGDWLYIS